MNNCTSKFVLILSTLSLLACAGEIEEVTANTDPFGTPGEYWCAPAKTQGTSEICPNGYTVKVYGSNLDISRGIIRAKYFWEYAGAPSLNIELIPGKEMPENSDLEKCTFKVYETSKEELDGAYARAFWATEKNESSSACIIRVAKGETTVADSMNLGMIHEVGHCYGLNHVADRDDIMFPVIYTPGRDVNFDIATKWDGEELNKRYGSSCD